ncbi:TetR/AcrR family transcriptional regulator [Nocardioides sp. 616]|uniref:TetR/AcrR family transcriptional regulator n=1 Tax=Nocardioides sp. 616 TaxID=2268090 RepID=UPI000CE4402E|nr:TetR/AcrR family transcriptional regulator [Nocardioides sp. 616]
MTDARSDLLPVLSGPPSERSDAARNRAALMTAAQRLIARDGIRAVTMAAVAAEAGVGKGTVFRRFSSRQGLMAAVLDHSEAVWQASVLSGPPPLGPGADPLDRLVAFGRSRLETTLSHVDLIRQASGGLAGRSHPAYAFAVMHLRYLLRELEVAGDLPLIAVALMAPLETPALDAEIVHDEQFVDRVHAGWVDLVGRVVKR